MNRDEVFTEERPRSSDFQFDEQVAEVFDDMLVRSVPFYLEQQRILREAGAKFYQPGTLVYDLGCSTGTTIIGLAKEIGEDAHFVGLDNSEPMLARARGNLDSVGLGDRVELKYCDLNGDLGAVALQNASVVTLCWTLQFIRPLGRDRLVRWIYDGMVDGGALLVTEKVLTNDSNMNRFFIDFYYDFKRRNGYSEDEILRKREALENRELMSLVELDISFDELGNLARARIWPKNRKVLELLGKHIGVGAFTERVEVNSGRDLAQEIRAAQERVRKMRAARGLAPPVVDAEFVSGE
jgi:tRNA (cmo5U34)-methyltransferase